MHATDGAAAAGRFQRATQAVFGRGPAGASVVLAGSSRATAGWWPTSGVAAQTAAGR